VKYVDEFRDAGDAQQVVAAIRRLVTKPWTLMEICGGQTHTIMKSGIDRLLPEEITLVHGPGCPVCVTPLELIDRAQAIARRPLARLDAWANRLHTWKHNPLYHSGALAVASFAVLLVTGLYLLLFYRIGAPYASVERITEQALAGRWIRSLHRYVSDLAIDVSYLAIIRFRGEFLRVGGGGGVGSVRVEVVKPEEERPAGMTLEPADAG